MVTNRESSESKDVTSGIPEGSNMRPLLFVILIYDLHGPVKSDIFLFSDHTKQDEVMTQNDVNEILKWADKWQLEFLPDK